MSSLKISSSKGKKGQQFVSKQKASRVSVSTSEFLDYKQSKYVYPPIKLSNFKSNKDFILKFVRAIENKP